MTAFTGMWLRKKDQAIAKAIGIQQRHDLGKLAFGFTIFWTYLFFAQYIVIWYGKLPWEQAWIIHRAEAPWSGLTVLALFLCFVIPFAGLIGRKAKMTPWILRLFATVILVGLWLERYLMVVPSIHDGHPTITLMEPAIGLFFLGLFLLSVRWFLTTFPAVQIWQPMVEPEYLDAEVRASTETPVGVRWRRKAEGGRLPEG